MEYQTVQYAIAHNFRTWCMKNVVAEGIDLSDSLAESDDAGRTVNPNAYYVIKSCSSTVCTANYNN